MPIPLANRLMGMFEKSDLEPKESVGRLFHVSVYLPARFSAATPALFSTEHGVFSFTPSPSTTV